MSFQANLDNIEAKTGNKPDDFKVAAQKAGLPAPGTTATQIIDWLARDFELGRGRAMAIFAVFKQNGWIEAAKKSVKQASPEAKWRKAMTHANPSPVDPRLDLAFERIVDIPREKIWAAWTRPEQVVQWFTPAPWQTVECDIDLRPGGGFGTLMRSPEGQDFPNTGCFLEIVPDEKLVWTNTLAPTSARSNMRPARCNLRRRSHWRPCPVARATAPAQAMATPKAAPGTRPWASRRAGARRSINWRRW